MIFRFSSSVLFLSGWEVFYWLIPCPVFLLSLPIIGLGGFLLVTWSFETHQLLYGARIFSMVPQFSSPVSLIGLRSFSPGSHFPLTILRFTELASEERGNCNNVTFGAESSRSSRSGSYMKTSIQNFTLVSLTSTVTPHPVGLPFGTAVPSPPMHSYSYALVSPLRLCTSRKNIPLRYLSEIVDLLRYTIVILDCRNTRQRS